MIRWPAYSRDTRAEIDALLEFNDLYGAYLRDIDHTLYKLGLARPDVTVFRHICANGEAMTADWLVYRYGIDRGGLSRNLRVLEGHGLVTLERRAPDRRYLHVKLTAEGRRFRGEVDRIAAQVAATLLDAIDAASRRQLMASLGLVSGILRHRKALAPDDDLVPHPISRLRRAD